MKARNVLEGLGVGILLLRPYLWPHLSSYHLSLYGNTLPNNTVIWGLILDLIVVSSLAALLFAFLEKWDAAGRSFIWSIALAEIASTAVVLLGIQIPHVSPAMVSVGTLVVALAARWFVPSAYQGMTRTLKAAFGLVGCSMVWILPILLYQAFRHPGNISQAAGVKYESSQLAKTNDSPGGKRIVWVVFDEMSYDQTFDHRHPDVKLPALDQFKSVSVTFSDLNPAGYLTDHVIPSLFTGNVIGDMKSNFDGELFMKIKGEKGWQRFDAQKTLFADAQRAGWTTGVAGWFNPYCRILAGTLDSCYWRILPGLTGGTAPAKSILENAVAPVTTKWASLRHHPEQLSTLHTDDVTSLLQQGETLIRDQRIRFVFIHLPVPHPPGIYDRTTNRFQNGGSYLDNLVLADRVLGQLMTTLKATSQFENTILIVCSDHSWRTAMWKKEGMWSAEDEAVSQDKFDPRPVLMIHFPKQVDEIDVNQPFEDVKLHAILQQMIQGKLQSPAELQTWIQHESSVLSGLNEPQTTKASNGN